MLTLNLKANSPGANIIPNATFILITPHKFFNCIFVPSRPFFWADLTRMSINLLRKNGKNDTKKSFYAKHKIYLGYYTDFRQKRFSPIFNFILRINT